MRDPKELVAKVDSSVPILIGILLLPLGLSLTPTDYRFIYDGFPDSCLVDSLEPLFFVTFLAIAFIQAAVLLSQSVQAMYTMPSLKPPLKVKVLACAAWIFVSLAYMLSMILIVMTCEVKLKKLECLPKWMSVTVIIICISVIMGCFYIIYAWIARAPDASPTIAPVAPPTTCSITSITESAPPVASPTDSSIAHPVAPDR